MWEKTAEIAETVGVVNGGRENYGSYSGGKVTAAELVSELFEIQDAFDWYVTKQKRIRACLKTDAGKRIFDPVTAVAYFRTGEFFPEGQWTQAAANIGLLHSACAEIVASCNYDWDPSCRQGILRQELLRVLVPQGRRQEVFRGSLTDMFLRGFRKRTVSTTH